MSTAIEKSNGAAAPAQPPASTAIVEVAPQTGEVVRLNFETVAGFEGMQRAARLLAASTLVPKEYQGSLPNCVIALNMSGRIGADPLMVMQNLYIVHGRPGWSSQFLIAAVNSCGRFTALRYQFTGERGKDSWGCRAWAIEKSTDERLDGSEITIALAKEEGWYSKSGSKWKTMPEQMLMYRAAGFWARVYAPELTMGLHTREEMEDISGPIAGGETVMAPPPPPSAPPQSPARIAPAADPAPATPPATPEPSTLARAAEVVAQVTAGTPMSADALLDAILAAKDQKALRALVEQVDAQPEPRRTELRGIYTTQATELAAKAKTNG